MPRWALTAMAASLTFRMLRPRRIAALFLVGLWALAGCGIDEKRGLGLDAGSAAGGFDALAPTFDAQDADNLRDAEPADGPLVDAEVPSDTADTADEAEAAPTPVCGNGKLEEGEVCDDGNQDDTDACVQGCQNARCGDGHVRAGVESCDDGNQVNTDACTNDCAAPSCGDGIKQPAEACDDGNRVNNDECSNACQSPRCGDNIVQAGEECDDANTSDADDCLTTCKFSKCVPLPNLDDNNPCTTDACDPVTGPLHSPVAVGTLCPDDNVCDGINKCNANGQCAATPAPVVPPSTACRRHSCDPRQGNVSENAIRGATCEDGNICNGQETCDGAGQCMAGAPASARTLCDDGNVCNGISRCNGQGVCEMSTSIAARGASCSQAQTCLVCNGQGVCEPPTPQNLDDGDGCTVDSCDLLRGAVSVPDARLNTACTYLCGRNCTIGLAGPICLPSVCSGFYVCRDKAVVCQAPILF